MAHESDKTQNNIGHTFWRLPSGLTHDNKQEITYWIRLHATVQCRHPPLCPLSGGAGCCPPTEAGAGAVLRGTGGALPGMLGGWGGCRGWGPPPVNTHADSDLEVPAEPDCRYCRNPTRGAGLQIPRHQHYQNKRGSVSCAAGIL